MKAQNLYYKNIHETIKRAFDGQADALEEAASRMADCSLGGGMIYTFGTGHGHLLALELFYRAGGLVRVCPILDERLMLHISASKSTAWERDENIVNELLEKYPIKKGDLLVSISNSGRNAVPVQLAIEARKRGAYVIALTSLEHTKHVTARNSAGVRLFEAADLVLDNCGVLGDASVEGKDGRMVGPTSTAVGAALLQALVARVEQIATERNAQVDFFASSNIDGGDQINQRYLDKYVGIIPGL